MTLGRTVWMAARNNNSQKRNSKRIVSSKGTDSDRNQESMGQQDKGEDKERQRQEFIVPLV